MERMLRLLIHASSATPTAVLLELGNSQNATEVIRGCVKHVLLATSIPLHDPKYMATIRVPCAPLAHTSPLQGKPVAFNVHLAHTPSIGTEAVAPHAAPARTVLQQEPLNAQPVPEDRPTHRHNPAPPVLLGLTAKEEPSAHNVQPERTSRAPGIPCAAHVVQARTRPRAHLHAHHVL